MKYAKIINEYMEKVNINSIGELEEIEEKVLVSRIWEWDNRNWRGSMENKTTLDIYYRNKMEIAEENFYFNTTESVILFKARTNTLKLGWRNRFEKGNVDCKLCGAGEETLTHFLKECTGLQKLRHDYGMDRYEIEEILLFKGKICPDLSKSYLNAIWKERKKKIVCSSCSFWYVIDFNSGKIK